MIHHINERFRLHYPKDTHWRKANCKEVDCPHYLKGWVTTVPSDSSQAVFIRNDRERHYTEEKVGDGLIAFRFEAGQRCFRSFQHTKKLERGGWLTKGFVGGSSYWIERAAMDVDEWIEDFNMASESKPPRGGWTK